MGTLRDHDEGTQKSKLHSESFHSWDAVFALRGANRVIDNGSFPETAVTPFKRSELAASSSNHTWLWFLERQTPDRMPSRLAPSPCQSLIFESVGP